MTASPTVLGSTATTGAANKAAEIQTETAVTPSSVGSEIKLAAPKDSGLADADVAKVVEFAKAHGLTQVQAEKVLARDAERVTADSAAKKQADAAVQKQHFQEMEKLKVDGAAAFAKDPDFGGEKLQSSIASAKLAISKLADPELVKFLEVHPFGSDPLVLRMLTRVGQLLREDGAVAAGAGNPGTPKSTDIPSKWYGKAK